MKESITRFFTRKADTTNFITLTSIAAVTEGTDATIAHRNSSYIANEKDSKEDDLESRTKSDKSSELAPLVSMFRWIRQRKEEIIKERKEKKEWEHLARNIDCIMFPVFLLVCIILAIVCLSITI